MTRPRLGRRSECRSKAGDAGSATVWVLCCCLLVWAGLAALARGSAVVARHRAESAADLAALAAAKAALSGADPCPRAAAVVAAAGAARLERCALAADLSVTVQVSVPASGWAGLDLPPARARARAGGRTAAP